MMNMKNKIEELSDNEQVKVLKNHIHELTENFNEKLAKLSIELKKYGVKGCEEASKVVEEHPLKSVGVALACGLFIGFLMGRK